MKHFLFYLTVTSTLFFGGCKKGAADAKSGPKAVEKIQPLTYLYDVNNDPSNRLIGILGRHDELQDNEQFHEKINNNMIISEENAVFPPEEILKMKICTYQVEKGNPILDIIGYWQIAINSGEKPICDDITKNNYGYFDNELDLMGNPISVAQTPLNLEEPRLIQIFGYFTIDNAQILEEDKIKIQKSSKIIFTGRKNKDESKYVHFHELRHPEAGTLGVLFSGYIK